MSDIEMGLIVLAAALGVILAPTNYLWAQVTLSYGLQHNRLRNAFWIGMAFGPLGPAIMHLLSPGDPVKFRRDVSAAYAGQDIPAVVAPVATFMTIAVAGFSYYTVAILILLQRLPDLPLRELGGLALCFGIGWLGLRNAFPPVKDLPAPQATPSKTAGEGPRLIFDSRLNRIHQAALLSRYGALMLCFLLVLDLFAMLVTWMSTEQEDLRQYFPLTVVIGIVIAAMIIAGFAWSRHLKRQAAGPGLQKLAAVCPVCDQPIMPGAEWVLQPGTCLAHHPRCLELRDVKSEELPASALVDLPPEDAVALTEPGRACRACGQFIDPDNDSYRGCPECSRNYHVSCFGDDVLCTYCANEEAVPAVAERIARENEAKHRVRQGAYDADASASPVLAADVNQTVCRSCGLFFEETDGRVACGRCRRIYHTVCTTGGGICAYCAAGESVPDEVEEYCRETEMQRFLQSTGNFVCPFCDRDISNYSSGYHFCPYCGADLDVPDAYQVKTKEEADVYADNLARGLEYEASRIPGGGATVEERHGWKQQENIGYGMFFLAFFVMIIGFVIANYLPQPADDLLRGSMLGLLDVSVIVAIVQWAVIKVRPWIWPMSEPSPAKLKLINLRTVLFWVAGLAGVAVIAFDYPLDAELNNVAHILQWITLCLGGGATFLAVASLFVK